MSVQVRPTWDGIDCMFRFFQYTITCMLYFGAFLLYFYSVSAIEVPLQ